MWNIYIYNIMAEAMFIGLIGLGGLYAISKQNKATDKKQFFF